MSAIPHELLGLRVEVLRSIRRTAALHIVGTNLQVRIPEHVGDERVAAILRQKRPWIRAKVAELKPAAPHRGKELISGESFPYLGRNYRLKVGEGQQVGVCLAGGYLRATVRPEQQGENGQARILQYLKDWYRCRALEHLSVKAKRYASRIGVAPAGISVRDFKARWGSCHKNGLVVFNCSIIKAPHSIIDYVVIHELCHLLYPNHSKAFWQLVGRYDERYDEHRGWLRAKGGILL